MRSTGPFRARSGMPSWKQKRASAGLIREHLGQVWGIASSPPKVHIGHESNTPCCTGRETAFASVNLDGKMVVTGRTPSLRLSAIRMQVNIGLFSRGSQNRAVLQTAAKQ